MAPSDPTDLRSLLDEDSTVMHTRFDPNPAPKALLLRVLEGPDKGMTAQLEGAQASRILIGHSPVCQIRLTDHTVSRRHVALEPIGQRVRILDLGSKNGTTVSGVPVLDAFLLGGEVVRIGGTAFSVEVQEGVVSAKLSTSLGFGRVLGASTEMRRLYPLCEKLANSSVPVIIEGETGTGKELLAEALHEEGPRKDGPFIVFDCTAVPVNLMETELFGHERGAFTGAVSSRRGVLEQAHGGTLLIDEIGDLDISLQPKLLRAIERGEFRPIGGERVIHTDVRIIAATRRDLDREVQGGRFRDDLFHRLAVGRIELPPLNRRRGDIPLLVKHFCEDLGGDPAMIAEALIARWEDLPWPGNIRELRNTVARHLALGELANLDLTSTVEPAPASVGGEGSDGAKLVSVLQEALELPLGEARQRVVEQFERAYVRRMMAKHGGNVTRAAEGAQVARRYFQVLKAKISRSSEE